MGTAFLLTGAFAVVAFCTAVLNLWIFVVRRRRAEHLWLGVTALGNVGVATAICFFYQANDLAAAQSARLLALTASLPLMVGFLRFTHHFLPVDIHRIERANLAFLVSLVAAMNLNPGWMFSGESIRRSLAPWGETYISPELSTAGSLLHLGFLLVLGAIVVVYWQHRRELRHARPLLPALALWLACGANDVVVSMGLADGPYLMALGYVGFALAFTGVLVRRFVASIERAEYSAELLQQRVEARTQELRDKDLQLAHGERMATVGALAAGLAHEINNPIAFISSNLNQLDGLRKDPSAEGLFEEVLLESREGVERIRTIVSELLRLARRGEGEHGPVDLPQVVESVLPILRHEARNRARLETRLEPVPAVQGDDRLLGQVVLNLVVNALHAIAEGAVEENRVCVSTSCRDGCVWLVVSDTGSGIPEHVLPRIFDPFFTTKEDGKGTGLGLAVTEQLVKKHRGHISVETSTRGTTFTVELPALADSGEVPPQSSKRRSRQKG